MLGELLARIGLARNSCRLCGLETGSLTQGFVCGSCLAEIRAEPCPVSAPLPGISGYRVFAPYEGVLAESLRLLKFRGVRPLAGVLGRKISRDLGEFCREVDADLLTFVPVHFLRWWGRGYDHNEEILRGTEIPFEKVLLRVKHSGPLASYGKEERFRKVRDAFAVTERSAERIEDRRVVVFDDVLTTGATAISVAHLLLSWGVREVFFYFLSREG